MFLKGGWSANIIKPLPGCIKDVSPSLIILTTSVALDQKLKPPLRSSSLLRKVKGESFPLDTPPGQRAVGSLAVRMKKKEQRSRASSTLCILKKNARRLADQQDLKEVQLDFVQREIAAAA